MSELLIGTEKGSYFGDALLKPIGWAEGNICSAWCGYEYNSIVCLVGIQTWFDCSKVQDIQGKVLDLICGKLSGSQRN